MIKLGGRSAQPARLVSDAPLLRSVGLVGTSVFLTGFSTKCPSIRPHASETHNCLGKTARLQTVSIGARQIYTSNSLYHVLFLHGLEGFARKKFLQMDARHPVKGGREEESK